LPIKLAEPIFKKLFQVTEYSNLSKEEKIMYDSILKRKWDYANMKIYEARINKQEGLEEGLKQGHEKGLKQGLEQARIEVKEMLLAIAAKQKLRSVSISEIASDTGLSIDEINLL